MIAKPETSIHAVNFTEESRNAVDFVKQNLFFLECQVRFLNDLLQMRGHVFLNEIYDCLSVDRTEAGALLGWWRDSGENIVFEITDDGSSLTVDFNVDGTVYNKLTKNKKENNEQGSEGG